MEALTENKASITNSSQLNKEPLYRQLYQILRDSIISGNYQKGLKLPSDSKLTKMYNVSRITVRRAVQELAADNLIEKRGSKGTFVITGNEWHLKHRYVFIHDNSSPATYPYLQFLLQGIQSSSENFKFRLEIISRQPIQEHLIDNEMVSHLTEPGVNGVIAVPGCLTLNEVNALKKLNTPIVFVGHSYSNVAIGDKVVQVECDSKDIISLLVSHLTENGRKRIGCIGKPLSGYRPHLKLITNVFSEMGVYFDTNFYQPSDYGISSATNACIRLLKKHPQIDALICTDDLQAVGAFQHLYKIGKNIPQEIAIAGVGNFLDENSHFDITTVDNRVIEQGKMAVKCLEDIIAGKQIDNHIRVQPILIRRKTT